MRLRSEHRVSSSKGQSRLKDRWCCDPTISSSSCLIHPRLPPSRPQGLQSLIFWYTQPTEVSNFAQTQLDRSAYLRPNLSTRNAAFGVYEIMATMPAQEVHCRSRFKDKIS